MKSTLVAALVLFQLATVAVPPIHAADAVPNLNVSSSCQAEAAAAPEGKRQCLRDEQDARATLTRQWEKFTLADRQRCTQLATLGGTASYVELLTCLQMAVDASKLPSKDKQ
jgi:hypothetical protein